MQQEVRPLYVGIDLGTTNSAVAVFDGSELAVVRNGQGSVLTPSVVRIDGRGGVLVGSRARRYLDTDPANTRAEFKRLMGTAHQLEFPAHGTKRRPSELAAEVLKSLRSDVADQTGVTVDRAVISVPALFELHQTAFLSRSSTNAGRLSAAVAGLDDVRRNIIAFRGGDLDAGEQVRRGLIDFDAMLADIEADHAWPELAAP